MRSQRLTQKATEKRTILFACATHGLAQLSGRVSAPTTTKSFGRKITRKHSQRVTSMILQHLSARTSWLKDSSISGSRKMTEFLLWNLKTSAHSSPNWLSWDLYKPCFMKCNTSLPSVPAMERCKPQVKNGYRTSSSLSLSRTLCSWIAE